MSVSIQSMHLSFLSVLQNALVGILMPIRLILIIVLSVLRAQALFTQNQLPSSLLRT